MGKDTLATNWQPDEVLIDLENKANGRMRWLLQK